jgi:two-component system, NarL family, invasion response regulator UvrY
MSHLLAPSARTNDVSIMIVDDHDVVRVGFRQILVEHSRFKLTAEANSAKQAFEQLRTDTFDIVLLDLSLPDGSGVDVLRKIRERYPDTKVLILSGFAEEQYGVNMLRAGAAGFLSKTCNAQQLIQAVETVAIGRRYISPRLAEMLADGLSTAIIRA